MEMFMKLLIAALALLGTLSATAQTLKWSYTANNAWDYTTDGRGNLAVISSHASGVGLGIITWVDASGRQLFTNYIADVGQNIASSIVRFVRFNRSELTVQVQASYEHAPGTNFLRRYRRNGSFTDTVLPVGENMDELPSKLLDNHGYFTRESTPGALIFRRYSN